MDGRPTTASSVNNAAFKRKANLLLTLFFSGRLLIERTVLLQQKIKGHNQNTVEYQKQK